MNNKIKKLKKTRKVKKNVQSGGYIVSPTNPYFMAVAAVIGGLYAYGKTQSSDTPAEEQQQSGGRKFRRTRSKRQTGGTNNNMNIVLASHDGNTEIVEKLLKNRVDVDERYRGFTALIKASQQGHIEILKMLLENGADVNAKTRYHESTALIEASYSGHTEIVEMLLENGADVNATTTTGYHEATALMEASKYGHTEIVKMLLENGANVNAKDDKGRTALYMAKTIEPWRTYRSNIEVNSEVVNLLTNAEKVRDNKQKAMEQVEGRVRKVPSLHALTLKELNTTELNNLNKYNIFPTRKKLGGKRRTRKKKAGTIKEMAKKLGKGVYRASKYPYRQLHKGVLGTISDGEYDEREAKRQKLRGIEYAKEAKEKKEKQEVIKKKLEESLKKIEEKGLIRVTKVYELKKSKKYVQLNDHTTEGEFKELGNFRELEAHHNPRPEDYDYPYSLYFEKDTIKKGSPKSSAQDLDLTYEGIYMYSDKAAFEQGINTQLKLIDEKKKKLAPTPQAEVFKSQGMMGEISQFMHGGRKTRRRNKRKKGTRRRNKRKKGTRRRKQKGGDRYIWDMVVDLTTMFWIRRPTSVAPKYNDIHDLKMKIIEKVGTTDDMADFEGGLKEILALFIDRDVNGNNLIDNQGIFEPGLKEHLIDILKEMCERPDADCSNQQIQEILGH
jgi:hypothetical protein